MKTDAQEYDLHVFVCTNEKEGGKGCGPLGAQELVNQLKSWSRKAGLPGRVRINKSGCLGRCESAIACVAYPKGEWVIEANLQDLPAIEQWIAEIAQSQFPSSL